MSIFLQYLELCLPLHKSLLNNILDIKKVGKWVPFCCTLGGGIDLGPGTTYKKPCVKLSKFSGQPKNFYRNHETPPDFDIFTKDYIILCYKKKVFLTNHGRFIVRPFQISTTALFDKKIYYMPVGYIKFCVPTYGCYFLYILNKDSKQHISNIQIGIHNHTSYLEYINLRVLVRIYDRRRQPISRLRQQIVGRRAGERFPPTLTRSSSLFKQPQEVRLPAVLFRQFHHPVARARWTSAPGPLPGIRTRSIKRCSPTFITQTTTKKKDYGKKIFKEKNLPLSVLRTGLDDKDPYFPRYVPMSLVLEPCEANGVRAFKVLTYCRISDFNIQDG
ncbi:hypothetical protein AGLY_001703 [Aphis glycines]|uniref:Uncharacterized protein n=1 Tax=Aphis glycines TaxID=307491 RepID=A0A6G0U4K9_APHGL|nr:hypothetical protein AGLY_001703 [Aphis glycines]